VVLVWPVLPVLPVLPEFSVLPAEKPAMAVQVAQAPAPPAPPQAPATDLASLQAQVAELQIQLSGLQAQWRGLRNQLDEMLRNNPARPGVQQQWADVGIQIARVEGQIAGLQARIAQQQGRPFGITVLPPPMRRPVDRNFMGPGAFVLLLALVLPLSIGWARRIARGGRQETPSLSSDQTSRFERLEQAVDAIAIEVERISEGQRFVTKILAERPARATVAEQGDAPAADPAAARALGAGPAEPIPVAEREGVRQRISTPR
jgi:hypothetical protein